MSGAPKPRMHGADHRVGGTDPIPGLTGGAIEWEDAGGTGVVAGIIPFSLTGPLAVANGVLPWEALDDGELELVHARVGVAPTGSGVTVRLKKNGTSVGTVTIPAGSTSGTFVPSPAGYVAGDVFTVDVTAVGSTTPGTGLVVQLKLRFG